MLLPFLVVLLAATPTTGVSRPIGPSGAGAVAVTFDSPGDSPRAIKETVVPVRASTKQLDMAITRITYSGLACGYTFRGGRPVSPVTIEMSGTMKSGPFRSGPVSVSWTDQATEQTDAGSAEDKPAKWLFVGAANTNRNGRGWVVSLTGISTDKSVKPLTARCTVRSATGFSPANGPVGYWSGFATR